MKIFDSLKQNHPLRSAMSVVTLGNFDGVHLGHQALFNRVLQRAQEMNLASCLITFQNHPLEVLNPRSIAKITSDGQKRKLITAYPFDSVIIPKFTEELAQMSADSFLQHIANVALPKLFIVGKDVGYGKDKSGNLQHLVAFGKKYGFTVEEVSPVTYENKIISSSYIRECIKKGELEVVKNMLGRRYSICGLPKQGVGAAKKMGFPTLNLELYNLAIPPEGVYAGTISFEGHVLTAKACVYIGKAKTLHPRTDPILEAYVLDNDEIPHSKIEVCLHSFLRPDMIFGSLEELVAQIQKDVALTRKLAV